MRKDLLSLIACHFILFHLTAHTQEIDEVRKQCLTIGLADKSAILVSNFHVSAPSYINSGIGNDLSMKLIEELSSINCFTVNKQPSDFIPGGTQALITGNLKDYYTSEGALGKPRIKFGELHRSAGNGNRITFKLNIANS